MITQERLHSLLNYAPLTGWFTNTFARAIHSSRVTCGARAGTVQAYGYRQIQVDGRIYKEHRLAWLYIYGYFPEEIDHKNGKRDDNRLSNLREVTRSLNNANSERCSGPAGLRGVTWFERDQKWKAQITIDSQCIHLGYFDIAEQAHSAYLSAADMAFGEHAYHNRESEAS